MAFKRSSNSAGGLQAAFDGGTAAQKAAFRASVSWDRSGSALARRLAATGAATLLLMSDSTGDQPLSSSDVSLAEWFYLFGLKLAGRYPGSRVGYYPWDIATGTQGAEVVIQAGAAESVTSFDDTFSGTSAELNGRAPDVAGNTWGYATSGMLGDWSVSGGKLIRSADASGGVALYGGVTAGDVSVTLTGVTISTVGDTAVRWLYINAKQLDANNAIHGIIAVETNGTVTARLAKRIGGTLTTVTSVVNAHTAMGITAGTANQTISNITVSVVGTTLSMRVGSTTIVTGSITAGDAAALAAATLGGLQADVGSGGTGPYVGLSIDRLTMTVTPSAATTPTIRLYQLSKHGSDLSYQMGLIDAGKVIAGGAAPDAVFISSCHNYGTMLGPEYIAAITPVIQRMTALYPGCDLIASSQNPRRSPDTKFVQQAARGAALAEYTAHMSYGYIAAQEKFRATAGWQSLIMSDGIHPTQGPGATGSQLIADAADAWYASRLPAY